jgi:hypothetical protein
MSPTLRSSAVLGAAISLATAPMATQALAWGHTGHLEIGWIANSLLPASLPAFLHDPLVIENAGELDAEPDVSKTAGTIHDHERDNGHFVDIDDNGLTAGVPFSPLLTDRESYDTALRAHGSDQYGTGYLAYNIVDGWQQLRKDFAYYRTDIVGLQTATNLQDSLYFANQLQLRIALIKRDLGYWSHFVSDGSQPMHVSVHYNGWGKYPNPQGYTTKPIHAPFEGTFVKNFVPLDLIVSKVAPYHDCACAIEQRVPQYLLQTLSTVVTTYAIEKEYNNAYATSEPDEVNFVASRLAAGAAELRDEIVDAWNSSLTISVGYPLIAVSDVLSGKVHLTRDSYAAD